LCPTTPALHSKWLLLLKIEISLVVNFRFITNQRGEDLNVIFYQNMSNLYNQYKSVERKISQKKPELLKIEISLVVNFRFITNQNELKF
jgi:hypothetical protein